MILSPVGEKLIQSFEECKLVSYQDQRGIWTIGWGHTGPGVIQGLQCDQQQADAWLLEDVAVAQSAVNHTVTNTLSQNQFDALVSFTYNVGAGSEAHSTLLADINAGNYAAAADQFLVWDHVGGVPNAGLLRRRTAERTLFTTPSP
jgi:lysozyme